ncbi:MAG: hypothetical protein K2W82_16225 [Candidatus Obscuribacterales bacterium]|nr:hypothetical protein [Candidatus Obscuribacterales bacterium]
MLLTIIITVLLTLLCMFFGILLAGKLVNLFGNAYLALLGPFVSLLVGIGFGLKHIPLGAGITAGVISALGALFVIAKADSTK